MRVGALICIFQNDITAIATAASVSSADIAIKQTNSNLDALLYPNPAHSTATLQIKGGAKNVDVSINDMSGKIIWKSSHANSSQINLPVEKLSSGVYLVTINNSTNSKTFRLIKE